jgi:ribosomal protein S18 acetylase RimI-like enzyme
MLGLSRTKFQVHPPQTGDLREVMRLAWKTTDRLYPYVFFEELARREPSYFRVVSDADDGRVLGFIIAARQPGTTSNFLILTVEPKLVGRGLRRALLSEVQKQLVAEGERQFTVEISAADQTALDFYRREGFDIVGVEPAPHDGSDRLLLSKNLKPTVTA